MALLQSQAVPGSSTDPPETPAQAAGHVTTTLSHSSDPDNDQLSVATRGAHRIDSTVHNSLSQEREVDNTRQAAEMMDILHALTFLSDQDAIILLSRLRMGESWSSVAESLPAYQSVSDGIFQRIDAYTRDDALSPLTPGFEPSDVYGGDGTAQ